MINFYLVLFFRFHAWCISYTNLLHVYKELNLKKWYFAFVQIILCGYIKILTTRLVFQCRISNERRGGSRTAATSKMKHFVITKSSILDIVAVLDPPLECVISFSLAIISESNVALKKYAWRAVTQKPHALLTTP